ncbi:MULTISPECIES: glycosyl hydrolase family 28-related protein [unclassified Sphingomonas]|jgi:hypothetical protein|uniref:glycosyl hydrolase family 28-related protein n=1 Tax=unclassified Sphingomonas TaxID=196159 RepID=UPI00083476BC|nr:MULTISPECIES: glycosyl hydrolase family 28-related protein [unclassified Sphingomonas]
MKHAHSLGAVVGGTCLLALGALAFTASAPSGTLTSPQPQAAARLALPTFANQVTSLIRSALYPDSWLPVGEGGSKDAAGRFLQDFSYAGYANGDKPIPTGFGNNRMVNAVTQYGADNTYNATTNPNSADATNAIQAAINAICTQGGGTVFLPAGTYRIRPQGTNTAALNLNCNNLILRGAVDAQGRPATFLFNDLANMRARRVIFVGTVDDRFIWYTSQVSTPTPVTQAVTDPTRIITVGSTSAFQVGAPIVIRTDTTEAFKAQHGMTAGINGCTANGCWWDGSGQGLLYYRTVQAILSGNRIRLDAPIRYLLNPDPSTGNNPRAYRTTPATYNVGIENIAIGMRENPNPGLTDSVINTPGTAAYETSGAQAIRFAGAKDSWVRNVHSFRPAVNTQNFHLSSIGIALSASTRGISVLNSSMSFPQNRLGGGNGYLMVVAGQDHLIRDSVTEGGRHNFQITDMSASGNVILGGSTINSEGTNDFHVALSHANLIDGVTTIGNSWQTINRGSTSNGAGITGTQNVFWNVIKGDTASGIFIQSEQFAWGYIIGTRGNTASVDVGGPTISAPSDWVEALNNGVNLAPTSLYLDQKAKRDANPNY